MRFAIVLALIPLLQDSVRESKNLAYIEDEEKKHKLNLFMPPGDKPAPVIVFIHGGAWKGGDRSTYAGLGHRFAERGIGFAAISYRLSPAVKHPEHVKDCARAFAWVASNIEKHGGDPRRLFVMGHSAGGHLAALLALDPKYLAEVKIEPSTIKGVIPMSGPYVIPPLPEDAPGILRIFPEAFGSDKEVCVDASPITHVKNLKAPMLVLTEMDDNLKVRPSMVAFKKAIEKEGVKGAEFVDAEGRNHNTIIANMFQKADDPYRDKIVEFVKKTCDALDGK